MSTIKAKVEIAGRIKHQRDILIAKYKALRKEILMSKRSRIKADYFMAILSNVFSNTTSLKRLKRFCKGDEKLFLRCVSPCISAIKAEIKAGNISSKVLIKTDTGEKKLTIKELS